MGAILNTPAPFLMLVAVFSGFGAFHLLTRGAIFSPDWSDWMKEVRCEEAPVRYFFSLAVALLIFVGSIGILGFQWMN